MTSLFNINHSEPLRDQSEKLGTFLYLGISALIKCRFNYQPFFKKKETIPIGIGFTLN